MQYFLTNAQMRAADEYTIKTLGVPSSELMDRAGAAIAAQVAVSPADGKKIVVVCGGGNNGGDGYVCAALLASRGLDVAVYDISNGRYSPDCALKRSSYTGAYTTQICGDIIIDCIFGTGLCRPVEGDCAQVINAINSSGAFVISADIPSGINGDNGLVLGVAVRADLTVAIAQYKLGHVLGDGPDYCGAVVRADIGIDCLGQCACAMGDGDFAKIFAPRPRNSHKGSYGSACIVAGSAQYPGAAALCLSTALRSGCGYVKLCTPAQVKDALVAAYPQAIYLSSPDYSCSALAIGPGLGEGGEDLLKDVLNGYSGPLIVDADGLNAAARMGSGVLKNTSARVLITPHVKEFSRLSGVDVKAIVADPIGHAAGFALRHNLTVLLKGAVSVITDGVRVVLNLRGTTALAKGGSGDMLTGLICGMAARGVELFDAAVCGCYVLGAAAEQASAEWTDYCATAQEIVGCLPGVIKNIMSGGDV